MIEQSPICQECPVKNACPLDIKSEKLANALMYEGLASKDAQDQLSRIKQVWRNNGCPLDKRRRLIDPLDQRINGRRNQHFNPSNGAISSTRTEIQGYTRDRFGHLPRRD
jgi:hypothetical protein